MASVFNQQAAITRTEGGLTIAGTRVTLYQLLDSLHAGHSHPTIRQDYPQLTDEQFAAAMAYIDAHRSEVEAEYQIVVQEDEEARLYWAGHNRDRLVAVTSKPGQEAVRSKLAEWKAQIESRASE
jgi:uncharacterized protein (DUF433 family)